MKKKLFFYDKKYKEIKFQNIQLNNDIKDLNNIINNIINKNKKK